MAIRPTTPSQRRRESIGRTLSDRTALDLLTEQRSVTFFEEAPVGLAKLTPGGRFLEVNRHYCELTGYSRQELLQIPAVNITHPDDLPENLALAQRLFAGEISTFTIEKRYLRKDGTTIWVRVRGGVVRHPSGEPAYVIGVSEEIPAPGNAPDPPVIVDYAGIRLDVERLDASWNGVSLALSTKEVLLLWYLVRHQGEVLPRERLFRHVWGYEFDCRSRTLDAHISHLRRKVPPLGDLLITVGQLGYTLRHDPSSHPPRATG